MKNTIKYCSKSFRALFQQIRIDLENPDCNGVSQTPYEKCNVVINKRKKKKQ